LNKFINLFLILFFAALIFGCEEDPSSVGEDLLAGQDLTSIHTLDSQADNLEQSSSSYIDTLSLGLSDRTLIGKTEQLTAKGVIKFGFAISSALKTQITNNELTPVNAYVTLKPDYSIGAANNAFGINVHKITADWNFEKFKKENLEKIQYNSTPFSSNFFSNDDTLFTIDLNKEIVFDWLRSGVDTTIKNYGALYIPTPESNKVFGFPTLTSAASSSELPTVYLIVMDTSGELDTLSATPSYDAFGVTGSMPGNDENFMYVQGGIPVHSTVKFDLSSLPKNAIIIEANLSFVEDPLQAVKGSTYDDSLLVSLIKREMEHAIDTSVSSILMVKSGDTFKANISALVQHWVEGKMNYGLKIRAFDDDKSVNKIALYSSKVEDVTLKPRLQIIYADIK